MIRQDFHFYHKAKSKTADKTLEQRFLKEFKGTGKNSGESQLKQHLISDVECTLCRLCTEPFNCNASEVWGKREH